jgi:DNA polymerase (family 10)
VDKAAIADTLEKIATLLELKGENVFKIRAYTNGARSIETWGGNAGDLASEETLAKIPGIGKGIAMVIKELVETGSSVYFEQLRAEFPPGILELFTISGLGAKKIKALHEQLQVSSIAELKEACESDRVAKLPGFGKTTQDKLCKAIADRAKHSGTFHLGMIAGEAETLRDDLRALEATIEVSIAGVIADGRRSCAIWISSFRRKTRGRVAGVRGAPARGVGDRRRARRSRACACVREFNATCGSSRRRSIPLR